MAARGPFSILNKAVRKHRKHKAIQAMDAEPFLPTVTHAQIVYGQLADGTPLTIPVTTMIGAQAGPRLVVTAGVHGDEFEGVRAVADLCGELATEPLVGTVVLVPVVNTPAFNAQTRTSPIDGVNFNRVCPGDLDGTVSERLAYALFSQIIAGADALVDLHSGGTRYVFTPQAGFYALSGVLGERSLALARAFGLDVIWQLPERQGVCSYAAMQAGIPAIGLEIGGNGRCEPHHLALAKQGVRGVLHHLGMLAGRVATNSDGRVWRGDFGLCSASGLFDPAVTLGTTVQKGDLLYRIRTLDGKISDEQRAAHPGLVSAIRIFAAINVGEWDVCVLQAVE